MAVSANPTLANQSGSQPAIAAQPTTIPTRPTPAIARPCRRPVRPEPTCQSHHATDTPTAAPVRSMSGFIAYWLKQHRIIAAHAPGASVQQKGFPAAQQLIMNAHVATHPAQ